MSYYTICKLVAITGLLNMLFIKTVPYLESWKSFNVW